MQDIIDQGFQFALRLIQGARQQFNGGKSSAARCPYMEGSVFYREFMKGVRLAEAQHNFDTGI